MGQALEVPQRSQAEICEGRNPALVVQCSCLLSLDGFCIYQLRINIRYWLADSDLKDVDLHLATVTAPAPVVDVSVHQESVRESTAIEASQAPTMDNVIPAQLCAALITCVHAPSLASTSNQLLLASAGTAAGLFVTGPSFQAVMQGPISMLPAAPIAFSGGPGAPVALPAPYSAIQSVGAPLVPYSAMHNAGAPHYSLWQACSGLVSPHLMLVHLWPI